MIEGTLRPATKDDMSLVLNWRNREEVRNNMYTNHVISLDEHTAWWERTSIDPTMRNLIFELDAQPIGVVAFSHYSGIGGSATWAFYAGDNAPKGLGRQMEYHALSYAFEELKVHKLICEVLSFNQPVIGMHRRYGFELEGIFREAYERDGEYFDIYRLAMFERDWKRHVRSFFESKNRGLVGQVFEKRIQVKSDLIATFAELSQDSNPIHRDDDAAQALGYDQALSHGLLSVSFFSGIFGTDMGIEGLVYLSQTADFLKPIYSGEEVDVRVTILSQVGRRILALTEVLMNNEVAITGTAKLLLPTD